MIQDVIVAAIVFGALAFLVRTWWRRAKSTECGENCCCHVNKKPLAAPKLSEKKLS